MDKKKKVNKDKVRRLRKKLSDANPRKPRHTRKHRKRTWCEQEVQDMLDEMVIGYEIEIPLPFKFTWKHYDIGLSDHKILIEVDGDFWHGNKKATGNTKMRFVQMKNKQNDCIKNWLAKRNGYKILRIQENEIRDDREAVKKKILEFIDDDQNKE